MMCLVFESEDSILLRYHFYPIDLKIPHNANHLKAINKHILKSTKKCKGNRQLKQLCKGRIQLKIV